MLHGQQWHRAGRPDPDGWLPDGPPIKQPADGTTCRIDHCRLWPQASSPFCHAHTQTWKTNGRPDIDQFATGFSQRLVTEDEAIRLDRLGPQLALEIQYAMQCRRDERTSKTFPTVVMQVVRFLATTTVTSLLDQDEDAWRAQIGRPAPKDGTPRALLIYARRKVEDLVDAGGWDAEYPRDVWRLRRSGVPRPADPDLPGDSPAVAAGPGQTVGPLAARHGPGIGGRPPRAAGPDPVRPVLRPHRRPAPSPR